MPLGRVPSPQPRTASRPKRSSTATVRDTLEEDLIMKRSLSSTIAPAFPRSTPESEVIAMKRSVPAVPVIQKCRGVRACMITAIPLSLLLGTSSAATAGPLFAVPFLSFDTASDPVSVAIGDLNGDGRADLATANSTFSSNTVSVLLGTGDGSFGAKTDYGTGSDPRSVAISDLNGDGKPDLATNSSSNTVSVLL